MAKAPKGARQIQRLTGVKYVVALRWYQQFKAEILEAHRREDVDWIIAAERILLDTGVWLPEGPPQ